MTGFFFFSSRRRHTRFDCDWSSDVCSSDLPHDRVEYAQRRRLATREHEISDRQLFRSQPVRRPLVHVFVMAAQQRQLRPDREPHRVLVREPPPARRQQHDRRGCPQILHCLEERLRLEHHAPAAPPRGIVHRLLAGVGGVPPAPPPAPPPPPPPPPPPAAAPG